MVEKGGPVRRSRRAASLTAQVLWSLQLEDDSNPAVRSNKKSKDPANKDLNPVPTEPKVERKRKASESAFAASASTALKRTDAKKRIVSTTCTQHLFPAQQPFLISKDSKPKKKLTASVAPLIKPRPVPIVTSQTAASTTVSNVTHSNPILLLPVSLQPNQTGENVVGQKVGGLQLVTVQAPPGFLNCLNLNKAIVNTAPATATAAQTKHWGAGSSKYMTSVSRSIQSVLTQIGPSVSVKTAPQTILTASRGNALSENVKVQLEPLNLKVGETTIPNSSKNLQQKQRVARIQPVRPVVVNLPKTAPKNKILVPQSAQKPTPSSSTAFKSKRKLPRSQPLPTPQNSTRNKRGGKPVSIALVKSKQAANSHSSGDRKYRLKCPSPDYACSSPDVDDVDRTPRHTCNKRHINLRNKAAPAPGTKEYELFVAEQHRLLSAIKRKQENKARAAARLEARKAKADRKSPEEDDDDDRPLSATAESFKLQSASESKHGWKWWGSPYTSSVYSVAQGKFVPRTCYPAIIRKDKEDGSVDAILVRDCVFLLAGEEDELSYVAKVCALWENPVGKEMTMSVLWYYRPEHVTQDKKHVAGEDEIFSSKHQDNVSVACIEQRCKVLTLAKFCRLHTRQKKDKMWTSNDIRRIVPPSENIYARPLFSFEQPLDPQDMFFCRYMCEVPSNRVRYKFSPPNTLSPEHAKRASADRSGSKSVATSI